jgi:ubiquinone/menaquinone biosynthesis C-methylase UbiE
MPAQSHAASAPALSGSRKFVGDIAAGYDAKRESSPKWILEQRIIENMLSDLPRGSLVFDCPIGTGRFLQFYAQKGFTIAGMDLQMDMLNQALAKGQAVGISGELRQGDIRATGLQAKAVDVTVACRVTRWLMGDHGPQGITDMLKELQRVTKHRIIITARVRHHRFAVSYDLIKSALGGWAIHRDETGVDLDYRILELRPC